MIPSQDIAEKSLEEAIQHVITIFKLVKTTSIEFANYDRLTKSFLGPDEYIIKSTMQSRWNRAITPHLLVLTNKKVVLLDPSYSDLHWHTNFFGATDIERIPYNAIKDVKLNIGRILSTITLKIIGISDISMHGIKHEEAKLISSIIENIIEHYG